MAQTNNFDNVTYPQLSINEVSSYSSNEIPPPPAYNYVSSGTKESVKKESIKKESTHLIVFYGNSGTFKYEFGNNVQSKHGEIIFKIINKKDLKKLPVKRNNDVTFDVLKTVVPKDFPDRLIPRFYSHRILRKFKENIKSGNYKSTLTKTMYSTVLPIYNANAFTILNALYITLGCPYQCLIILGYAAVSSSISLSPLLYELWKMLRVYV